MTEASGIDVRYWNGMTGRRYINEVLGGGGALFDADGDGDLDLFAVQGKLQDPSPEAVPVLPPPELPRGRLLLNQLISAEGGRSEFGFVDGTAASGLDERGYGMGALAADVDNDGDVDLYVLNFGPNALWRNRGGGRFEERGQAAGVAGTAWSTAGAFFDYDQDGWLDLFVGNYLELDLRRAKTCFAASGRPDYCGPASFEPAADRLYRNRGDGSFEDVTARVGLATKPASALGAVTLDADQDGWLDLFVANDGMPNHLWRWRAGRFEESALLAGCAVNADGLSEASMGADAGDVDGDGDEDLFMAHLDRETNTLYLGDGEGFFEDSSDASGLGLPSFAYTGFGSRLMDVDNDGRLDLVVVNGAIQELEALARRGDAYPLHQRNQFFLNRGGGRFALQDADSPAFTPSHVSRGLAAGDLDNDGDLDVVIFNNNGPLRVLRNRRGTAKAWIGLEIVDPRRHRAALGSRVRVTAGDPTYWRRVRRDGSYASSQDPRLVVGLGDHGDEVEVEVEWLGGGHERWTKLGARRYHVLEAGSGRPIGSDKP